MTEIYLDNLASTAMDPAVLAAMTPWMTAAGNPHARNRAGWRAAEAVEQARVAIAGLIGATPGEIVFTSGATEANNLALLGAAGGRRVIVSAIEHASVLNCLPLLAARGNATGLLPVDGGGLVDLDRLERLLAAGPALVSVMSANNEIGTLQPLAEIAAACRRHGALLHVDAAQSLSTLPIGVAVTGIDLLSLSGHKIYGPMGIGALFVRDGISLSPILAGGGQQAGRRPGTVPTALAVGLGTACGLARTRRLGEAKRIAVLRDRLFGGLAAIPGLRRNSPAENCLPGCLSISLADIDAADLLLDLPDIALSTGSACGNGEPSHVLRAIGLDDTQTHGSIRFGVGRNNNGEEIEMVIALFADAVSRRRGTGALSSAA